MSDELSFTELDGQHVELLPTRTVLSLLGTGGGYDGGDYDSGDYGSHDYDSHDDGLLSGLLG